MRFFDFFDEFVFMVKNIRKYAENLDGIKKRLGEESDGENRTIEERLLYLEKKSNSGDSDGVLPPGLNSLLMLVASIFIFTLAGFITLYKKLGFEILYDFASYAFPFVAALIAGYGVILKKKDAWLYWTSSILLFSGFYCYFLSKGAESKVFLLIVAGIFLIPAIVGLIFDEYSNRGKESRYLYWFSIVSLGVALVVAVPASVMYVVTGLAHDASQNASQGETKTCQIDIPKTSIIKVIPKASNATTPNGSEAFDSSRLPSSSFSIVISPCIKVTSLVTSLEAK